MATAKSAKNTRKPAKSRAKPVKRATARKTSTKPSAVLSEIEENSVVNQEITENSVAALANAEDISTDSEAKATKFETGADSSEAATIESVVETTKPSKSTDASLSLNVASIGKVFEMKNMEIPNVVREAAEKSVEQVQATYNKFKDSAEEATNILEDSIETSRKGMVNLQEKVLDAAKTNSEATFDFCKSMVSVKSFSEALELQSGFAKQQFETVASQGKDFQDMASKLMEDVTSPAKEAAEKVFG